MLSETLDHFDGLVAELSSLSFELQRDALRLNASTTPATPSPYFATTPVSPNFPPVTKPTVSVPPTMRKPGPLPSRFSADEICEKSVKLDEELRGVLEELKILTLEEEQQNTQVTPADSGCSLSVGSHPDASGRPQSFHSAYSADDSLVSNFNDSSSFRSNESRDVTPFHADEARDHPSSLMPSPLMTPVSPVGTDAFRLNEILIKVHSPDETCKTISINDKSKVFDLLSILLKKHRYQPTKSWCLREILPDLFIERLLEDHLLVLPQIKAWNPSSKNRLLFIEDPRRFDFIKQPEIKEALSNRVYIPNIDGVLYLRSLGKKSWKSFNFVLRASGIYYSSKKRTNQKTSDLVCLYSLQDIDVFSMLPASDWRNKLKAPTEFAFALRLSDSLVRYLCCPSQLALDNWLLNLRLVKYGHNLMEDLERPIILPPSSQMLPTSNYGFSTRNPPRSVSMNLSVQKPNEKESTGKSASNSSLLLPGHMYASADGVKGSEEDASPTRRPSYKAIIPLTNSVSRHFTAKSAGIVDQAERGEPRKHGGVPPPVSLANVRDESDWFNRTPTGDFVRFPSPDFSTLSQSGSCEMLEPASSLRGLQNRFSQASSSFNRLQQVNHRQICADAPTLSRNRDIQGELSNDKCAQINNPKSAPVNNAKYGELNNKCAQINNAKWAPVNTANCAPVNGLHHGDEEVCRLSALEARNIAELTTKITKQKKVCFESCVDEIGSENSHLRDKLLKSTSHDSFKSSKQAATTQHADIDNNNGSRKHVNPPPPPPPQRSHETRLSFRNNELNPSNGKNKTINSFSSKTKVTDLPPPPKELLEGL